MDIELVADVRNKLTPAKTALEMLVEGKDVPKEFLAMALKGLSEAVKLTDDKWG